MRFPNKMLGLIAVGPECANVGWMDWYHFSYMRTYNLIGMKNSMKSHFLDRYFCDVSNFTL